MRREKGIIPVELRICSCGEKEERSYRGKGERE